MKRRTFLKSTAAVGASLLATGTGTATLGAADKSGSKNPVIGPVVEWVQTGRVTLLNRMS